MNKFFILLLSGILLISLSGCKNSSEIATSINNSTEYFTQDDLIEIEQLPWEISSDETREIIGDIDENNLKSYDSQIKLMPINQLTFTDIGLTSSIRCYFFDEQDKLYNVWYSFSFNEREQAEKKMEEVNEFFKENFPSFFEYKYNEKSSTVLIDAVT